MIITNIVVFIITQKFEFLNYSGIIMYLKFNTLYNITQKFNSIKANSLKLTCIVLYAHII